MIIRIRSPEGQTRLQVEPQIEISHLFTAISKELKIDNVDFKLFFDPQNQREISIDQDKTVASIGLRHGDMVYVAFAIKETEQSEEETVEKIHPRYVKQNQIDDQMEKMDGLIKREKSSLCKHGATGMCDWCMPLEPYDQGYLDENKIKHMSFHAYLKRTLKENKTAPISSHQFIPPLETVSFKVTVPCPSKLHGPYPEGICTKCQPSSATLQTQSFRMVDHVEFQSAAIVDNFLRFWRNSGYQRYGILYGRYEPYSEVPLGVKAVVCAIYEPPQSSDVDYIQLGDDQKQEKVDEIAGMLGLEQIGVIYTDLIDDGSGQGKVICKRHEESYFLSSAECVFAANLQRNHSVPCRYSSTGTFGSRMVTCVVSGNEEGSIEISSYQISNIGVSMAHDGIIEASIEASLMRVKPSTKTLYVPEVFYRYKNKYGIMVKEAANPTFPVEYLLVTLSHGFPSNPDPTFLSNEFPIENRGGLESQSMDKLQHQLNSTNALVNTISDFHLLLFMADSHILEQDAFKIICEMAANHQDLTHELERNPNWQTFALIMQEAKGSFETPSNVPGIPQPWACKHCTFVNEYGNTCEMCSLPRDS